MRPAVLRFEEWIALQELLLRLGYGLCHQLPERSYITGGLQAPVCVRDTGIYVGFSLALMLIVFLHRGERPHGFPRLHVWVVMGLLLAFMGWDGVSSYAGFRPTTNWLRLITGTGVGFSIAVVVVPMLNDVLWKRSGSGRVLDPIGRFAVWSVGIPATVLAIGVVGPALGALFPVLIALSIFVTLTAVNAVMVGMLPWFDRRGEKLRDVALPLAISLVAGFVEIAAAGAMRAALESFAGRIAG